MSWLVILEVLFLIGIVGIVLYWWKFVNNIGEFERGIVKFFLVICVATLLLSTIYIPTSTYGRAVALPYEYQCACDSVEESKQLLMRYENLTESWGSLGQGLESFELKSTLQEAIIDKNNLKADILGWLNNPWQPFRDVLSSNLPDDFYSN